MSTVSPDTERNKRVEPGAQYHASFSSALRTTALALMTLVSGSGCSDSQKNHAVDSERSLTPLEKKVEETSNKQQLLALEDFLKDPEPQVLFKACQTDFLDHGITPALRLSEEGRIMTKCQIRERDGTISEGYTEMFSSEEVVLSKEGVPYIRETAPDINDITRERFHELYQYYTALPETIRSLPENSFEVLCTLADSNRDKIVSDEELGLAMMERSIQGKDAQLLSAIAVSYEDLQALHPGLRTGIDSSDFTGLNLPDNSKLLSRITRHLQRTSSVSKRQSKSLYGIKGYPTPYDGSQFRLGNCYLVAAINALVAVRPHEIGEMISPRSSDGGYSVNFKGLGVVEVPAPTQSELLSYTLCGRDGYWKGVLVKAFGKIKGERLKSHEINDEINTDNGGNVEKTMRMLTGVETRRIALASLSGDELYNLLLKASSQSQSYCFSTIFVRRQFNHVDGLTIKPTHAYSGIQLNPKDKTITVLDPTREIETGWFGSDLRNGVANVPVNELVNYFQFLQIETGIPERSEVPAKSLSALFPQ